MKQKFIKLFMLLTAFAFITSATAQQYVDKVFPEKPMDKTIMKKAPASWEQSTKDVVFSEIFPDATLTGWTTDGEGAANWASAAANTAGGAPNEANLAWSPQFVGQARLISPVINTTGYTELSLSFLHYLDSYDALGYYLRVATTSDGGTTWNDAWELHWTSADNYAAFEVIALNTPDVGSENFQFCYQFEGDSYSINWWAIDNITLGDPIQMDVTPTAILGFEENLFENDDVMVSALVNNYGAETVTFDITLEISDGTSVVFENTQTASDLVFGEQVQVDFDTWVAIEGITWTATVTTELTGDENPDNDMISHDFVVYPEDSYCIPSANCTLGDGFSVFAWAGIENYDSGCSDNGYGVFTDMTATVEIGYSYTATIASPDYGNQYVSMWIDFDLDYEFEEWERILTDYFIAEPGVMYDVDIPIPGNGMPGTTTMRIAANYYDISSPDPCADLVYGEFEDYTVIVTGTPISYNAMTKSIDLDPLLPAGDVTPYATVKNMGVETVSFPVTMTVEGTGYSSTVQVTDLALGDEIQVEFDTWNAPTDNYIVEVCTELVGDEIPDNDCMTAEISTITYDVGVGTINMFSTMMLGDVTPKATIVNYGFEMVSFPVTMTIEDADYTSTVEIVDLPGQDTIMVDFDTWSNYIGQHQVDVCTELSNDENLENDCEDMLVTVSEDARQKVVMELFTGLW